MSNLHGPRHESENDFVTEMLQQAVSGLKEGGPPPDAVIVQAFIDKALTPEQVAKVEHAIGTWKDWNALYWTLWTDELDVAEIGDAVDSLREDIGNRTNTII